MIPALLFVIALALVCGALAFIGAVLAKRQQRDDVTLLIKPPRPYVDKDGRSDYRPELREKVAAFRERGRM